MNDTPGWASPGSAPSDGQDNNAGVPRPAGPADETGSPSKWSKAQPPAGQWSQPAPPAPRQAPGQYGGPGGGGAPGWGGQRGPGWGPPPAAKPGVIPLRPLGIGEILDGAVSTMRAHWRTVLGVTVSVSVVTQICQMLVTRYLLPEPPDLDPNAGPSEALDQAARSMQSSLLSLAPTMLITLIGTLFTTAVLTMVISRSVLGRPVTLKEAWLEAKPRLPQLLGLTLLLPVMAAAILAVCVLPGILVGSLAGVGLVTLGALGGLVVVLWLMIRFALASPALMLERQGVMASLRRSAKLVRGSWWRVFGVLCLAYLITLLVTLIIGVPFSLVAMAADGFSFSSLLSGDVPDYGWVYLIITGIGSVIASSITLPINAGVTVLLYIDRRIRREALDLDLARAAGVPVHGPGSPGDDVSRS
ncbi:membrane protein [Streptomyces sp. 150FB]|uniref:DUF7544 domain-containing protein n=1 Tax=Streptomyces sp. 150FB TaxID=1576605 RepID=UPI000588F3FD|nr:glycerophosphoryl diester phosphodiesterase membrane domain-containing protein [Streptomyces sp. 150FB]KIF74690.1 membrane protein [Streptomyces sp. 150FB]